jgi:2-polyprenyl-3-methyl-5-hydroxy-6-metoxy-1,4-benzoquinol methylase
MEKEKFINNYYTPFHSKLLEYTRGRIKKFYTSGNCLVCGPSIKGEIEKDLINYYDKIVCVDKEKAVLDELKRNIKSDKFEYIEKSFYSLEPKIFDDLRFDTILALHVLEHLESPVSFLKILKYLLKDKGKIIIITPNAESLHRYLEVKMGAIDTIYSLGENDLKVGHRRVYDMDLLETTIIDAGLEVYDAGGILVKPFHNDLMQTLPNDILDGLNKMSDEFSVNCADIFMVAYDNSN